jgi:hypothetical protein
VVAKQFTYDAGGMEQTFMDSCKGRGDHAIIHSYGCWTTIR